MNSGKPEALGRPVAIESGAGLNERMRASTAVWVPDVGDDAGGRRGRGHIAAREHEVEHRLAVLWVGDLDALAKREGDGAPGSHGGRPGNEHNEQRDDGVAPAGAAQGVQADAQRDEEPQQGEISRMPIEPGDIPRVLVLQAECGKHEQRAADGERHGETITPGKQRGGDGDRDYTEPKHAQAARHIGERADRPAEGRIAQPPQRQAGSPRPG